ncbi:hypothetical protein BKA69DRAFT_1073451 [Paraphysoderma sedebokerense]|nr:hypothetical protein BKA69DRAFT_1073451 [Paraphysoderma sedebokerense]
MTVELPQQLNSLSHHDDLEDIESLTLPSDDPTSSVNRPSFRQVTIKRFNRRKKTEKAEYKAPDSQLNSHSDNNVSDGEDVEESMDDGESFNVPVGYLPGKASVWVKTWGCSHNNSDSEYMAGLLNSHGYNIVSESQKDSAQLWLLNSCTVKNPSEQTFVNAINAAKDSGKHVVLAGCVTQAQPKNKIWEGLSIVGVQQIDRVVEVVEETLKGHTVKILETKKDMDSKKKAGGARLNLPKIRKNPLIEIIPINTGCLNQCTYCKTKHARGDLGSYPPEEILARVRQVLAEGVVEIWLTSEDTGTYGRDIGASLPDLLWKIVEIMPEGTMLRVGMTNPPYILEHLEEISKILAHPRVYAFLHVPVQAASNKVLDDMRRQYTLAEFKHVVDFLRDRVPGMTIATDVICGFPTESEEDFEETLQLVQEYKFPVLHISQVMIHFDLALWRLRVLTLFNIKVLS